MTKKDLRIIYMGTPEFAVPSLEILIKNGYNVVAVVTAPDRPAGRGQKLRMSDVKQCALKHNIPTLQPEKLKDETFLDKLKSYNANLQIVVAFRMLPEVVWNMPEIGTFNLHGSLLPQYRGAAPINWAIINGEKETGVTTFFLQHKIDTGDILLQDKEPISDDDNVGSVYNRLMHKGANLVLKTVRKIENNDYSSTPQNENQVLKEAPKIFKETCKIDWSKSSLEINNLVRGLSPYPVAWSKLNDKTLKIYDCTITDIDSSNRESGEYKTDGKTYLHFATADNYIAINELQLEGKKRMNIEDFLRGYNFN